MFAWEQRKLGGVAKFYSGGTPSVGVSDYYDGTIPFIRSAEINSTSTELYLSELGLQNSSAKMVHRGDILYALYGATSGEVGISKINGAINQAILAIIPHKGYNSEFLEQWLRKNKEAIIKTYLQGGQGNLSGAIVKQIKVSFPSFDEQQKIGKSFQKIDSLITLHQRKPFIKNGGIKMITSNFTCDSLFKDYFEFWIKLYKEGAVRPVTLEKYRNNQKHITKIIPNLKMKNFDRNAYQELLNQYALTHERQTVIDFHHQVKGAILDAVDDGLIDRDPTRKAIFKGKAPREKKQKYLNQFELHNLLEDLDLGMEITWDWLILLIAKTGLRFSEALGLTPADFDFARQTISVNKTWDYKTNTGFQPTKNRSSIRKVQMDWQLGMQFQHLIKNLNEDEPIFVNGPVCNSTPNNCLARHCRKCGIPEISIHGLRHTHASLLMFAGVSIASVSRRLGHSSITTTQKVYMHIISELENQDNDLVMRYLSSLS